MDLDFNKLLPKISESDLRSEIRKEYAKHDIFKGVPNPFHALDYGTPGISLRAQKPG